jgi:hypothetical protein
LRGAIGLQDEEIDELDRRANLAVHANGLADQRDLSDLPAVIDRGQHGGAAAEAAFVRPFDPAGEK